MAKLDNIRIYKKAQTTNENNFTARCAAAEYSNIYSRLYRMGWRLVKIKSGEAAPKYITFEATRNTGDE